MPQMIKLGPQRICPCQPANLFSSSVIILILKGIRSNTFFELFVDEKYVCSLEDMTFYRVVLEPGSHQLTLRYVGKWRPWNEPIRIDKDLIANLDADHAYFYFGELSTPNVTLAAVILFEPDNWITIGMRRQLLTSRDWHLTGEVAAP